MGKWNTSTLLPCINIRTVVLCLYQVLPLQEEKEGAFVSSQNYHLTVLCASALNRSNG